MMLFQRVKLVANEIAGSEIKLAKAIGIHPRTLNGYLNEARQDNLWPILEKIMEAYPQINRNWLWHGEGEILAQSGWGTAAMPLTAVMPMTTGMARHAQAQGQAPTGSGIRELEVELTGLRQRVVDLEGQIKALHAALDAKDEALDLYKALSAELVLKKDRVPKHSTDGVPVPGGFTSPIGNARTGEAVAPL